MTIYRQYRQKQIVRKKFVYKKYSQFQRILNARGYYG